MGEKPERLTKRRGVWHFVRRVPPEFAGADKRGIVKLTTGIKVAGDKNGLKAARVAARMEIDLEAFWRARAMGVIEQASIDFDEARRRAKALGLDYKPIEAVAAETAAEIMRRVDVLAEGDRRKDPATAAAIIGGVPVPQIMLSSLFAEVRAAKKTTLAKFSPNQVKKWENAKRRAAELLLEVLGADKAVTTLTRADALKFAEHWEDRVVDGEITAHTANKNITHVSGMVAAVSRRYRLRLEPVFAGTRLEGDKTESRPPFSAGFIVNRILSPGALADMNDEERAIIHVLINTGARPVEVINLQRDRIVLDAEVPHIQVRADDRVMKTEWSLRDIPLVGVALDAMRAFPVGFPRYFDKGDVFSGAANKYLEEHGLRETDRHSVYSLRHGFKDRLRETEAPDELKDELMGHNPKKPKYGDGHGLRLKLKYISLVALKPMMPEYAPLQIVPPGGAARG